MRGPAVVAGGAGGKWWFAANVGDQRVWVRVQLPPAWTVVDVAHVAAANEVAAVYVLGGLPPRRIRVPKGSAWTSVVSGGGDGAPIWRYRLTPQTSDRGVSIVDLAVDVDRFAGPWHGLEPAELLNAFGAYHKLMGAPWSDSVGHSAERLILATHPRSKGGVGLDRSPMTPEPIAGSTLEMAWQAWAREWTSEEQAATYVHSYDGNAQYLGAWIVAELGHGNPHHVIEPRFDSKAAAFWRYPGLDRMPDYTPTLPRPWLPGREWFHTSTVARMLEVCDGLSVPLPAEAWIWPQHSRWLRSAGERLRDARRAALAIDDYWRGTVAQLGEQLSDVELALALAKQVSSGAVLEAVKALYRIQTGRFGMDRAGQSAWARPDWGHAVRATARVNLHRRLEKLGQHPFAIATDGLLFATDEPDGLAFAERIRLPIGGGLGEYSYDGTCRRDLLDRGSVADMFRSVGYNPVGAGG